MNEQTIKVLLVEDEPSYATLLGMILKEGIAPRFSPTHASCLKEAIEKLGQSTYDVILLDLTLPDRSGIASYEDAQAAAPVTPIIVLTGLDDQELALQAVREGAQDFVVKGQADGKMLARIIRYAIERKRAAEAMRHSEEFFRLISESVTDLIAVLDCEGRRLYNSPSYRSLLGDPSRLPGTDSFAEIHPDDRAAVQDVFRRTVATGVGHRCQYRMRLGNGEIRHIESQGSPMRESSGRICKVVVVSRDITEQKESMEVLQRALTDVKQSHEQLKATQMRLIQAEKLEAVSTFAAGVAHEVKNPLQTIILGVDYLTSHFASDETAAMVLGDMGSAVQRADGIIKGLLEFSAYKKKAVQNEDLSAIIEQALHSLETELASAPIQLEKNLRLDLPLLRLDLKTMKHVFINLLMYCMRAMSAKGGTLRVRTFAEELKTSYLVNGRPSAYFKEGETVVVAEVEDSAPGLDCLGGNSDPQATKQDSALGLAVLKKIIELYGGIIQVARQDIGSKYTIAFKAHKTLKPV